MSALADHMATGASTVCRAWDVTLADGEVLCFTDHDKDLEFEDRIYKASSALMGAELQSHIGLMADNGAVTGALQDDSISEEDLITGRFDNADIRSWLVNWADPSMREILFAGFLGEVQISDGVFSVELRSHSERLNQPYGRRYLRNAENNQMGETPATDIIDSPAFPFIPGEDSALATPKPGGGN
ncbi:MAG: DUF2163 domain-containing protein [Pseudomonadota bacterium]